MRATAARPTAAVEALRLETRERFLRAIAERVTPARVAELHLFAPIRQGGVETGIAVIATRDDAAADARCTVLTARYRATLKGPERGRWEFDVVPEAEAPLATVDAVVRGVHRRAGDEAEAERLTGDALAPFTPAAAPPTA